MSGTVTTPPGITIDRLALSVPGLDRDGGTRLAESVAGYLARAGAGHGDLAIPRLAVTIDGPEIDLDHLARRIADAILRRAG